MLESALVKKVHKYCAQNNLLYINLQKTNLSGIPDALIINRNGQHFWFELKREDRTGRLSPIQEYRIKEMRGFNCVVNVVDSLSKLKEILNEKVNCNFDVSN